MEVGLLGCLVLRSDYCVFLRIIHSAMPVRTPKMKRGSMHWVDPPNKYAIIANPQVAPVIHSAIDSESGRLAMCALDGRAWEENNSYRRYRAQ
jgi:hypothetical protein